MIPNDTDRPEDYKYCWKCYEKAHGFIPDQWNPWVRGKCESCGLSTECFRSPTEWEKKNVYEHLQTDQAGLPAFVAELEALEAKAKHSQSPIGSSFISTTPEGYDFAQSLIDNFPALFALVRQLQGENAKLTIQASKYAYECELAKRERDRAEARFHSLMIEGKITNG